MELGGSISIVAVNKLVKFDDSKKELVNLLKTLNWYPGNMLNEFLSFDPKSIDLYVSKHISIWISRNNYNEIFTVADHFYELENINSRFEKAEKTDERYIITFRSLDEKLSKTCLLFCVAICNLVDGVVDLTAMVCDIKFNNKIIYDRKEWEGLIFNLIKKDL